LSYLPISSFCEPRLAAGRTPVPALDVCRRLSVVVGFYRVCVIDAILDHSPADYVRRPTVRAESPTLGLVTCSSKPISRLLPLAVLPMIARRVPPLAVVLNQAELVVLWVSHDDDHTLVVVVPLTGEPATEIDDRPHGLINVVDGDVEVDPHLASSGLRHWLEHQPRLRVTSFAEVDPAFLRRPGRATEQGAPESGYSLGVKAIDRDTGPGGSHVLILTEPPAGGSFALISRAPGVDVRTRRGGLPGSCVTRGSTHVGGQRTVGAAVG
jgi:hypothetical protein